MLASGLNSVLSNLKSRFLFLIILLNSSVIPSAYSVLVEPDLVPIYVVLLEEGTEVSPEELFGRVTYMEYVRGHFPDDQGVQDYYETNFDERDDWQEDEFSEDNGDSFNNDERFEEDNFSDEREWDDNSEFENGGNQDPDNPLRDVQRFRRLKDRRLGFPFFATRSLYEALGLAHTQNIGQVSSIVATELDEILYYMFLLRMPIHVMKMVVRSYSNPRESIHEIADRIQLDLDFWKNAYKDNAANRQKKELTEHDNSLLLKSFPIEVIHAISLINKDKNKKFPWLRSIGKVLKLINSDREVTMAARYSLNRADFQIAVANLIHDLVNPWEGERELGEMDMYKLFISFPTIFRNIENANLRSFVSPGMWTGFLTGVLSFGAAISIFFGDGAETKTPAVLSGAGAAVIALEKRKTQAIADFFQKWVRVPGLPGGNQATVEDETEEAAPVPSPIPRERVMRDAEIAENMLVFVNRLRYHFKKPTINDAIENQKTRTAANLGASINLVSVGMSFFPGSQLAVAIVSLANTLLQTIDTFFTLKSMTLVSYALKSAYQENTKQIVDVFSKEISTIIEGIQDSEEGGPAEIDVLVDKNGPKKIYIGGGFTPKENSDLLDKIGFIQDKSNPGVKVPEDIDDYYVGWRVPIEDESSIAAYTLAQFSVATLYEGEKENPVEIEVNGDRNVIGIPVPFKRVFRWGKNVSYKLHLEIGESKEVEVLIHFKKK